MLSLILINESNENNIKIDQKKLLDIFEIGFNALLDMKNNSPLNEFCAGFKFDNNLDIDVTIKIKNQS